MCEFGISYWLTQCIHPRALVSCLGPENVLTSGWNEGCCKGKKGWGCKRGLRQTDKHSPVATLISETPHAAIYHSSSHGTLKTRLRLLEVLLHANEWSHSSASIFCLSERKQMSPWMIYFQFHLLYLCPSGAFNSGQCIIEEIVESF